MSKAKKLWLAAFAGGAVVSAGSASAAIDTTAVTSALTDAGTAGAAVAAAVLVVVISIRAFKYIRAAL